VSIPSRSAARRVAVARLLSLAGTSAAFTALLFVIYDQTRSSRWVAAALLLTLGVRGVLSPLGSLLGDRFDRRMVMIVSDLAGAGCFAAMAFIHGAGPLLAMAFLTAVVETPFFPAASGAVPNLVPVDDLAWANSTVALGSNIGYLVGPALGGAMVGAVGAPTVFAANAVSFVISAGLVTSARGRFSSERVDAAAHRGLRAGFRFIAADPVLSRMTVSAAVFAVTVGSILVAELPLATLFGTGAFGYGLISTCWGTGALFGSLAGRWITDHNRWPVLVIGCTVTAAGLGAVAIAPAFGFVLGAMLVAGASDGLVDVGFELVYQIRSPDEVRSRVMGALETVFLLGLALSFPFAGVLIGAFGPRVCYAVAGAGTLLSASIIVPLLRRDRAGRAARRPMETAVAVLPSGTESGP
jgi:MFS family permease